MRELSLHVLDVLENAVEAGASRIELEIEEDLKTDTMVIEVSDNGPGMSEEAINEASNPFYTTRKTRHVGLGLPLFSEAARRCDGDLTLESEAGKGTRVRATFRHSHIDRAPLGNMATALLAVLLSERPLDLGYTHRVNQDEFRFDSAEIREQLEEIPLNHPKIREWLYRFLCEGEAGLRLGRTERKDTLENSDRD